MSFEVTPISGAIGLCTLDQVKDRLQAKAASRNELTERLIAIATATICHRYGRDFIPRSTETRTFEATSRLIALSGDLVSATSVSIEGVELDSGAWRPRHRGPFSETFGTIAIARSVAFDSPAIDEFGFVEVSIDGTWGIWASTEDVSEDVNAAAIDTVASWLSKPVQDIAQLTAGDPRAVMPAPVGTWDIPSSAHRKLERWSRDLGVW